MLLLITFPNETMPFIEDGLSEEECIRAINKAKELGWEFQENRYVVESDRIIIHAWKRNPTRETRKKNGVKACLQMNGKKNMIRLKKCVFYMEDATNG